MDRKNKPEVHPTWILTLNVIQQSSALTVRGPESGPPWLRAAQTVSWSRTVTFRSKYYRDLIKLTIFCFFSMTFQKSNYEMGQVSIINDHNSDIISISYFSFWFIIYHHQHIRTQRRFGFLTMENRLKYRLSLLMALRFVNLSSERKWATKRHLKLYFLINLGKPGWMVFNSCVFFWVDARTFFCDLTDMIGIIAIWIVYELKT